MKRTHMMFLSLLTCCGLVMAGEPLGGQLKYETHWVGNTFNGAGKNGEGRWVQNMIDEIEVAAGGVVITASTWDEAGRCTALYADGKCNYNLLKQYNGKGGHKAWGWGTAGKAVAVHGNEIFLANNKGDLMRFRWEPPRIDSARYVNQVKGVGKLHALAAGKEVLVSIGPNGRVVVRHAADFKQRAGFDVDGATDVAVHPDGTLWLIAGKTVVRRDVSGKELPGTITDLGKPSAIAVDPQGRLVVCDDGPRQQVLVYEGTTTPKLVATYGDKGGIRAGTPGIVTPTKFYGLRGANFDKDGNLYVALCIGPSQGAGTTIRSFDPQKNMRWQLQSLGFVDGFCFDPAADGRVIYSTDEIMTFDPAKAPGKSWGLKAVTRDRVKYPEANGHSFHGGAVLRRPQGRRLLGIFGQQAGGVNLAVFESKDSHIAYGVGRIGPKKRRGWAWYFDAAGDIWWGDAPNKKIHRYRFQGWSADGKPTYDQANPEAWDRPAGFTQIGRVVYVPDSDTLYVTGYTPTKKKKSWGLIGSVLARYDGWTAGKPVKQWEVDLPRDEKKLHPKCIDVAGDYAFTVQVKSTQRHPAVVTVFDVRNGKFVGRMWPDQTVGGVSGWVDMTHGLQAIRRRNGEYLILVEEDFRGKNLLYRWKPRGE